MAEEIPDTGVTEPIFARVDVDELHRLTFKRPQRNYRFPWRRHLELGRQQPNQWMLASRVTKGGCRARAEVIARDRVKISGYVQRNYPLERWQLRQILVPDTYCDRELYMRFLGTLTPEEDALDRKLRRERYDALLAKAAENKAKRALKAREDAAKQERWAQQEIRARRRPGG